jgi:hypothetical protein
MKSKRKVLVKCGTPLQERFELFREVDGSTGCWNWTGPKTKDGYGQTLRSLVHRLSFQHHVGPIDAGNRVCHSCDNPSCFNPAHLFQAPQSVNMKDMVSKKRQAWGSKNSQAKLTPEQVVEIRKAYVKGSRTANLYVLADRFSVSPRTISQIVAREKWAMLD